MHIIIFPIFLFLTFQKQDATYYNKYNKPTTYGIDLFIKNNHDNLIAEYEYKIDSIYDVYIYTDNLKQYNDIDQFGIFYIPDEIMISNEELFIEYEFKNLSKFKQKTLSINDKTVKAVIFHELTHVYFNQILKIRQSKNLKVSSEYINFKIYPNAELNFGTEFIEEGICEYVVYYLKETSEIKNVIIPENKEELLNPDNKIFILYQYSVYVLKDFLNQYGIKKGIEILISNKPPTYEEILDPELFFKKLTYDTGN